MAQMVILVMGGSDQCHVNLPAGVALDEVGNLFISDEGNNRIRKVTTNG